MTLVKPTLWATRCDDPDGRIAQFRNDSRHRYIVVSLQSLLLIGVLITQCSLASTAAAGEDAKDNSTSNQSAQRAASLDRGNLTLVEKGRPLATIVVPVSPDVWTKTAAGWLKDYIERATGASLPIVNEGAPTSGVTISIGHTKLAAKAKVTRDDWKWDTARMVVQDETLFLIGRDDAPLGATRPLEPAIGEASLQVDEPRVLGARGTCKAVVSFLEDQCGIRWFLPAPDGEWVPKQSTLSLPRSLDRTIVPVFAYSVGRDLYGVATPASFANNFRSAIRIRSYGGHSYYSWVPTEKYFKDHPEYFALINGKRTAEGNHLCTSNPEVRKILIRKIREEFDAGYDWVQLGQEDNYTRCQCEQCDSLDHYRDEMPPDWYEMYDQTGFERLRKAPCERLLTLHKAIADAAFESHPNKTVHLLVYRQTLVPSQRFKAFGNNVVGEMCNINPQAILPWKGKVRAFTAYLYWFDVTLGLGMGLHTTPTQAAGRIRYLRDENFIGIYQIPDTNWGLEGPVYWTIARTMGNPDLDPAQLVEEYCRGVFENAAPSMSQFFKLLYKRDIVAVERSSAAEQHLFYYPPSLCVQLENILREAESAADTERSRMWVRLTREHFDYIKNLSFVLAAYEAFKANPSDTNLAEFKSHRDEFDRFRQHLIDLDNEYTSRWFPGYERYASFVSANGEDVYYTPWSQRREQVKREGMKGKPLGYAGPCLIREPFVEGN